MNKDFLSLVFSFAHTDAIGAILTLELLMTWDIYQKGRYDILPYFLIGAVAMLFCKSLLKADKTQKREAKVAQPILNEDHEV